MRLYKFILIVSLTMCAARSVCFADDESLQAAILTQEMMMDIGKNGLSVLGKFADAKNIEVLKNVASKGGEMADVAERSLKILNAYNDGVRGDELKEMVTLEIGDYAYSKIKSKTMDYIKEHVTSVGQLTAAYDLLGTLHDSSYYIVYIGMSIGLDMMDPETARKLEQSKFTKAAEKVTELTNKVMNDAKAGAEEIKEKFLAATEGTFLDKFASSVTGWSSKIWNDAKEGAKELFGSGDDTQPANPSGDDVILEDSPRGDQIVSDNGNGEGKDGDATVDTGLGNDSANGDLTKTAPDGDDGGMCYAPKDDYAVETDATQYPGDNSESWAGDVGSGDLPSFSEIMNDFADKAALVGPNFPYRRMLWAFSGESLTDSIVSVVKGVMSPSDPEDRSYLSEMKAALQKITGLGN